MREDPKSYEMKYDLPIASADNYSSVFQTLTTQEDLAKERRGRSKDKSRPRSRSQSGQKSDRRRSRSKSNSKLKRPKSGLRNNDPSDKADALYE